MPTDPQTLVLVFNAACCSVLLEGRSLRWKRCSRKTRSFPLLPRGDGQRVDEQSCEPPALPATPESVTNEIEDITHLSPDPSTEAGAHSCLTKMWPRRERELVAPGMRIHIN